MSRLRHAVQFSSAVILMLWTVAAMSEDWPMWRHDVSRSASMSEELPTVLNGQWSLELGKLKPAWPEDDRLLFDAHYEPVIVGETLFVSSSRNDSVSAFNLKSGERVWRFHAGGPVRFAPTVVEDRLYFGADDGFVYALKPDSGALIWKQKLAPSNRLVIGNERMISVWPVRGGPVVDKGVVYVTVGVWPFEGTFVCGLDAQTGTAIDVLKRRTPARLNDRTPQGYLALSDSKLFIPCGRSIVTTLDRTTGQEIKYSYRTHSTTSYHVSAHRRWVFHGMLAIDTETKASVNVGAPEPVIEGDVMIVAKGTKLHGYDLGNPKTVVTKDRRGKDVKTTKLVELWSQNIPTSDKKTPVRVHFRAGDQIVASQGKQVFLLGLLSDKAPTLLWRTELSDEVGAAVAANQHLVVSTAKGAIHCFSATKRDTPIVRRQKADRVTSGPDADLIKRMVSDEKQRSGYCLVVGLKSVQHLAELANHTDGHIICVDPDPAAIEKARSALSENDLYGSRISLLAGDPLTIGLPPYFASMTIVTKPELVGGESSLSKLYQLIRPYGGVAFFEAGEQSGLHARLASMSLPGQRTSSEKGLVAVHREGALPGASNWTHEYGDPTNSLMSQDELVRAPLGVLWFGGPASDGDLFYNRHFWGPSMAVINGRMFIQGPGKLTAVDVYTGRILWKTPLEHNENYNPGRRGNDFEGAIAGFHFLAVDDGVYLVIGRHVLWLDPETGRELGRMTTASEKDQWGRIRVVGDIIVATTFRESEDLGFIPAELVAMNRRTGKTLWTNKATLSFPVYAISNDTIYAFDGAMEDLYRDWKRRGLVPKSLGTGELRAYDLKTGESQWKQTTDMVVTWLSYSQDQDVLLTSNKKRLMAWNGKDGNELWRKFAEGKGFRGHPENLWDKVILWKDRILDQRGPGFAYDLKTGEPVQRQDPISGETVDWEFTKAGHHCNYAIANPHMMTFRADSAGFCDIDTGNTSRLEGYRSGCRNSLIPANGVLNSPNFAHGCVCGYSVFTSLALVHTPENEVWSYSAIGAPKESVKRIGVNFGAPGDRVSNDETLWLDYPNVGGSSPAVAVNLKGKVNWFQRHSREINGDGPKWVGASGFEGNATITVPLQPKDANVEPNTYRVRLFFAEPDTDRSTRRLFDVTVQGKKVLAGLDVTAESGAHSTLLTKVFAGIKAKDAISIQLAGTEGEALLCGIEIVAEHQ